MSVIGRPITRLAASRRRARVFSRGAATDGSQGCSEQREQTPGTRTGEGWSPGGATDRASSVAPPGLGVIGYVPGVSLRFTPGYSRSPLRGYKTNTRGRMLELFDATKTYVQGRRTVNAVRGVTLRVQTGEFVTIMG